MTLRAKVLLANIGALVIVCGLVHLTTTTILTEGFRTVERHSTRQHTERAIDALGEEERNVCRLDWAAWDDTYQFIQDQNSNYKASNLVPEVFKGMDLELMSFFDASGQMVWARWFDHTTNRPVPLPPELAAHLKPESFLLKHQKPRDLKAGLLALSFGTLMIGSRPIVKSDFSGAIKGTFVAGRLLTAKRLVQLSERVHLETKLRRADISIPSQTSSEDGQPQKGSMVQVSVTPKSDSFVSGSGVLKDVYGRPVLYLQVSTQRGIYQQGQETLTSLLSAVLAVAAVFAILCLLLMERLVLSRLSRISEDVSQVASSGELSRRVADQGTDELGNVALAINDMLQGAEAADMAVRKSESQARDATQMHEFAARRFQELFDGLPVACFSYDSDGIIHEWNRASETMWGIPAHEAVFRPIHEVIRCLDASKTKHFIKRVFSGEGIADAEWRGVSNDGRQMWLYTSTIPLLDANGNITGAISTNVDITGRKAAELLLADKNAQLVALAATDSLTGLANHRAFRERLDVAFADAKRHKEPLSVILLDVDRFKAFNDNFGHPEGDRVLIEVGRALIESVRPADLVARYGGEEFVILLPKTDAQTAMTIAERCRVAIESRSWEFRSITASFGVATWTQGPTEGTDLISLADLALYASKDAGRNQVTHSADLRKIA